MLKARPHGSKTNDRMADRPRMTPIVDFGWSRQSPDLDRNYLRSLYMTMRNCLYTAILLYWTSAISLSKCTLRSQLPTDDHCCWSLAFIQERPPGGVGSTIKASETSSQFHSLVRDSYRQHLPIDQAGDRLSRSSHANAMGSYSYTIAKISIDLHILSIAFPAILPWTFPGRIYVE